MDEKEFFNYEKEVNLSEVQGKLAVSVRKVQKLQEKKEWKETEIFKKLIEIIGSIAPISLIEELQKHYQSVKDKLIKDDLLSVMDECGISSFEMTDGTPLKIKEKVSASIPKEQWDKFVKWAKENNEDLIIKDTLKFPMGELKAEDIEDLIEKGLSFKLNSTVANQSLVKMIKTRLESGEDLPPINIVKVSTFRYVDIK